MAVFAIHLNGRSHFAIDVAVAMRVLREVAVHAVHADVQVHRSQVHGFLELLRICI